MVGEVAGEGGVVGDPRPAGSMHQQPNQLPSAFHESRQAEISQCGCQCWLKPPKSSSVIACEGTGTKTSSSHHSISIARCSAEFALATGSTPWNARVKPQTSPVCQHASGAADVFPWFCKENMSTN